MGDQGRDVLAEVILAFSEAGPRQHGWVEKTFGWGRAPWWMRPFAPAGDYEKERALLRTALHHGVEHQLLTLDGTRYDVTPKGETWATDRGREATLKRIRHGAYAVLDAASLCAALDAVGPCTADEIEQPRAAVRMAHQQGWVTMDDRGRLHLTDWGRREGCAHLTAWR